MLFKLMFVCDLYGYFMAWICAAYLVVILRYVFNELALISARVGERVKGMVSDSAETLPTAKKIHPQNHRL